MKRQPLPDVFRCPKCGAPIALGPSGGSCSGKQRHRVRSREGLLTFASPPVGKYDADYAARYAGLWAYGFLTVHEGWDEPLYRTVASLVAEALVHRSPDAPPPLIVDCGCGVGRVAGDCAVLARKADVIALDASPHMLRLARRVTNGARPVSLDLRAAGFSTLAIPGRRLENVLFARADVEDLPLRSGSADMALSVNVVDRLPHGPDKALRECFRILRPGGCLVFTDPLNWLVPGSWRRYPTAESILNAITSLGFEVRVWFDSLVYRERLDRRGALEEFPTVVVVAERPV